MLRYPLEDIDHSLLENKAGLFIVLGFILENIWLRIQFVFDAIKC